MEAKYYKSSWIAFILFYLVVISIISVLDWVNGILSLSYWGVQVGLVTLGVGIFAIIGIWTPDLSAARGVFLTFTVGILTIIPAVLMGLGLPDLWPKYFNIAFGMAAGSFLFFLFMKLSKKIPRKDQSDSGD
jgi:hypothetical protein